MRRFLAAVVLTSMMAITGLQARSSDRHRIGALCNGRLEQFSDRQRRVLSSWRCELLEIQRWDMHQAVKGSLTLAL